MLQGSVLGLLLYILYTSDIPNPKGITQATCVDDTAILTPHQDFDTVNQRLQSVVNKIHRWMQRRKIAINLTKSVHVTHALRKHRPTPIHLDGVVVPAEDHAKYLGVYIDKTLTWRKHITTKHEAVQLRLRSLYWLL